MKKTKFIVLCAMALTVFAMSCNSNRSETVNTEEVVDSTEVVADTLAMDTLSGDSVE